MKRIFGFAAASALVAAFVINGFAGSAYASLSGTTIRGAIGGDFDSQLTPGSVNSAIIPGSGGSRFGFKLIWDSTAHNGDTFIDAVWAYKFP